MGGPTYNRLGSPFARLEVDKKVGWESLSICATGKI